MAKRLGKGINALFQDINIEDETVQNISINDCRPNPYQPRKVFDEDTINELKESILEYGIIQPLIVRKSIKGYEIVAGERRYRAAKEAGLTEVPVIVKDYTDHKMMEIALLENLQREDLTPVEEAQAYVNILNELQLTQEELSKRIGKSRSHIANMTRLLSLPDEVIHHLNSGKLSMGHGRAILGIKDKNQIVPFVNKVIKEKLNVRQVEQLINQLNAKPKKTPKKQPQKDIFIAERETLLRNRLGTKVSIQRGKKKGKIEIEFYSDEDLDKIINTLNS